MKYLLSVLLILGVNTAFAANAQQVYAKIIKANHINKTIKLIVVKNNEVNAYCDYGVLVVNTDMIRFARSSDELAVILGHEISHCLNGDRVSRPAAEYRADRQGVVLAYRAGYDVCRGVGVVKRLREPGSRTHPASIDRYNAIKCK